MGRSVLYNAVLCREPQGHLFRAQWSVALTEFECCPCQLPHLRYLCVAVGRAAQASPCWVWRSALPRQGSARLPVWSAGEVWRKTEGLQMLSTVELSARVGATASPFPPVAWPHPSLQCPLPRPLGHVLQIHLGEPESPVWPWGRCACGPQEDRLGHTPFNASAELPWPIPAWRGLDSDHLEPWIMVERKIPQQKVLFRVTVNKAVHRWQRVLLKVTWDLFGTLLVPQTV